MTVSSTAPKPSLTSSNSITLSSSPSSSYKPPPSPSLSPPHSSTPSPLFARNTLIRAFAATPTPHHSLTLFRLLQTSPLNPYDFTYPFSLKAYARYSSVTIGESLHSLTLKTGVRFHCYVGSALLNIYADCRAVVPRARDVVSWSSMIAAYVACNSPLDAFHMFREMGMENEEPNSVTLVSLLSACTKMLNLSASVHSYITRNGIEMDVALGTALFEMYAKCGEIDKAFLVFNSMGDRNLQSCTIMISALANHGREKDVISLFNQMEDMGLRPDSLSFAVILSACR
ncbi:Pentatricopeptide repeat-containing protein, chloroplastic [Glycine max]|nr:Pentatricopeptide repeat-containing protein, chloroplastic [Glycine max]